MCGTERSQARGVQVLGRHEGQFSSEEDFYITKGEGLLPLFQLLK